MQAFVPKNRRPKFDLTFKIIDLNNVPLVSGTCFVKWHIAYSTSADHRGRTPKSAIKDHKVQWDYEKTTPVRLTVDKNSMLQESDIHFEVLQEYSSGARGERIVLGHIKLNLAEYVEGTDGNTGDGITRRYLMQDSKINSTLKISVTMKQTEGDKTFFAPPLKSAPVFGGIAGIVSNEAEQEDPGHMNAMNIKSRENGELQDMYRRSLAASFAAQAGELPADECIESIFAGGDGWRDKHEANKVPAEHEKPRRGQSGRDYGSRRPYHRQKSSLSDIDAARHPAGKAEAFISRSGSSTNLAVGDHAVDGQYGKASTEYRRGEVDELEIRENLRSWTLPLSR